MIDLDTAPVSFQGKIFDSTIMTSIVGITFIKMQRGIRTFTDFSENMIAEGKEDDIPKEFIVPYLYPSWQAAAFIMDRSIDRFNDKLMLLAIAFILKEYECQRFSFDEIKEAALSVYGKDMYEAVDLEDYLQAAYRAVVSFFYEDFEIDDDIEDDMEDEEQEDFSEESQALAAQWRWEDEERASQVEKETGKSLEQIAQERIEVADRNMESTLEVMNRRTQEQYKDNPTVMRQEMQWNRMIAQEMRQEELKNL